MDRNRTTAIVVGTLFITATVAYSLGVILLDPILRSADYLTIASENEQKLIIGSFLVLIDAIAVAGIGIALYPVLKKHNETLAFAYAGARISEGVLFAINVIPTLTLLTLSHDFIKSGTSDASCYQTIGSLLITAGDWTFLIGFAIAFTISALILNFVLYRSRLVPRWLSIWGFAGALLLWIYYLLQVFNMEHDILFVPIAVQEMAFALWLITKGFDISYND